MINKDKVVYYKRKGGLSVEITYRPHKTLGVLDTKRGFIIKPIADDIRVWAHFSARLNKKDLNEIVKLTKRAMGKWEEAILRRKRLKIKKVV